METHMQPPLRTHSNTVGHTAAAMSQWALVSGQALSLQLAQASSDSGRLVDQEPERTAVSKSTQSCAKKDTTRIRKAFHTIAHSSFNQDCTFLVSVLKGKGASVQSWLSSLISSIQILVAHLISPPLMYWRIPLVVEEPWQVVLSLDSGVHLQPVGQESWGSLMIFDIRTSRCSEDMNKTYGPSDRRPEAFRVSNEI